MADVDEVDMIRTDSGEALYRRCGATHHHHLTCRDCGLTVELVGPSVEKWSRDTAAAHGFSDVTHVVELFGVCAACAGRVAAGAAGTVSAHTCAALVGVAIGAATDRVIAACAFTVHAATCRARVVALAAGTRGAFVVVSIVLTVAVPVMEVIHVIVVDNCLVPACGAVGMGVGFRLGMDAHDFSFRWARASPMMCDTCSSVISYTTDCPRLTEATNRCCLSTRKCCETRG
jgi:hypothetical protein